MSSSEPRTRRSTTKKGGRNQHKDRVNFVPQVLGLGGDANVTVLSAWARSDYNDDDAEIETLREIITSMNALRSSRAPAGQASPPGAAEDHGFRPRVICRFCLKAYLLGEWQLPKAVSLRVENFKSHKSVCVESRKKHGAVQQSPTAKRLNFNDESQSQPTPKRVLTAAEVKTWHAHLLELVHHSRLPDSFVEEETTKAAFEFLFPGISEYMPTRREFGGSILSEHALQRDKQDKEEIVGKQFAWTGARVNLLSDVWKNTAKLHLMGNQISLFGRVTTLDVREVKDRHDGVATAKDLDSAMHSAVSVGWKLGSVATDNAGQCGKARRVLALRWPHVAFLFCFAHCVNNLVKQVLKTAFPKVAKDAATIVNILQASSAKYLLLARKAMKDSYGDTWAFITLCDTRWNSMQGCFASLLRVCSALMAFNAEHCRTKTYPKKLHASYRLQRDENTIGDVVRSFAEIYLAFSSGARFRKKLVACVEQRWRDCEQPLFLLGYALHPTYATHARRLVHIGVLSTSLLSNFAIYYYRRFIGEQFIGLRGEFESWMAGTLTFADAGEWTDDPLPNFWKHVKGEGAHKLPVLAMTILSIAVNTASCERLFSELGSIHTAVRNRLDPQKVVRIQVIRKSIRDRKKREERRKRPDDRKKDPEKCIIDPRERKPKPQLTPIRQRRLSLRRTPERNTRDLWHENETTNDDCDRPSAHSHPHNSFAAYTIEQAQSQDDLSDRELERIRVEVAEDFSFWNLVLDDVFDDDMQAGFERERQRVIQEDSDAEYDYDEVESDDDSEPEVQPVSLVVNHLEPIPAPLTEPLPETNSYVEQEVLSGLRAWKISLAALLVVRSSQPVVNSSTASFCANYSNGYRTP